MSLLKLSGLIFGFAMNLPPSDFWVKAAAGIGVGIFALFLERADAALAAKHAARQGNDELSPWYERKVVYVVAGVWIAVLFTTGSDLVRWRSEDQRGGMTAQNTEPSRTVMTPGIDEDRHVSNLRNAIEFSPQRSVPSAMSPNKSFIGEDRFEGVPPVNLNVSSDTPTPVRSQVGVVKDEGDYALLANRLARRDHPSATEAVAESRKRTTSFVAFRPKSGALTINVDSTGPLVKDWYADTTQSLQAALSRGKAGTGTGFIVLSEGGKLEFSKENPKHCEATVEYRNGKLISARFDDHSSFVRSAKGRVSPWAARGPELRFGLRSREGDMAWFETFTYPPTGQSQNDTKFVASLYPEDKRMELKISCPLAVNSSFSDVGTDDLAGGSLTIATPLKFWAKRPLTLGSKDGLTMVTKPTSPESQPETLLAIERADRGLSVQQDESGWHQVILPLRREDVKAIRP